MMRRMVWPFTLSLVILVTHVLTLEWGIYAKELQFLQQRSLIDKLFKAYEKREFIYIRTLIVPEIIGEVEVFGRQLDNLALPDVILSHDFKILGNPKIYADSGEHGTKDIMADVEVCDRVLAYSSERKQEYEKTFYLFYHFHFDRESGDFNVLAPITFYVKETNCAP